MAQSAKLTEKQTPYVKDLSERKVKTRKIIDLWLTSKVINEDNVKGV